MGAQAGALAASTDVLAAVDAALTDHDAAMERLMDPQALVDSLFPPSPHAMRWVMFGTSPHNADCTNVPGLGKSCEDEKVEPYWESARDGSRTFISGRVLGSRYATQRQFLAAEADYLTARAVADV